jgi:hypothetical protein
MEKEKEKRKKGEWRNPAQMAGLFPIVPSHVGIRNFGVQSPTLLSAKERTGDGVKGLGG